MSIDPALLQLCPHTVSVQNRTGVDGYNKPTYATAVSYTCLVEYKPRMVRRSTGQEVVSSAAVYLTSAPGITTDDKVTLPDGSTPLILSVGRFPDTNGDLFEVIYV